MITFENVTRYFSSTTDTGPWDYLFYDANSTGCVTFSNASGTTDANSVSTDISFTNSDCLAAADIKLRVEGVNGCVNTADISLSDPCSSFAVSGINFTAPYTYSVNPSGGTAPYTYIWYYDETLFSPVTTNLNSPSVTFELVDGATVPSTSTITCKVSDSFGCTDTLTYSHTFCTPSANNVIYALVCEGTTGNAFNALVYLDVTTCTGINIDWAIGPSFSNVPTGMILSHGYSAGNTAHPVNRLVVSTNGAVAAGTYNITYTVKDTYGVTSSPGILTIVVPTCSTTEQAPPIQVQNKTIRLDCTVIPGDIVDIDISDAVVPSTDVDWTSLLFTDSGTNQTATVLGEAYGYDDITTPNVTYSSGTKTIHYEVPHTTGTDSFEWSISTNGPPALVSNGVIYTIIVDCATPPVAVNDTACVICGQSVVIDILTNDTIVSGVIDTNSVVITSGPDHGTVNLSLDGVVTYTANSGYTGTDEFTYTVNNNESTPQTSNEATVTITIICAGEPANVSICN